MHDKEVFIVSIVTFAVLSITFITLVTSLIVFKRRYSQRYTRHFNSWSKFQRLAYITLCSASLVYALSITELILVSLYATEHLHYSAPNQRSEWDGGVEKAVLSVIEIAVVIMIQVTAFLYYLVLLERFSLFRYYIPGAKFTTVHQTLLFVGVFLSLLTIINFALVNSPVPQETLKDITIQTVLFLSSNLLLIAVFIIDLVCSISLCRAAFANVTFHARREDLSGFSVTGEDGEERSSAATDAERVDGRRWSLRNPRLNFSIRMAKQGVVSDNSSVTTGDTTTELTGVKVPIPTTFVLHLDQSLTPYFLLPQLARMLSLVPPETTQPEQQPQRSPNSTSSPRSPPLFPPPVNSASSPSSSTSSLSYPIIPRSATTSTLSPPFLPRSTTTASTITPQRSDPLISRSVTTSTYASTNAPIIPRRYGPDPPSILLRSLKISSQRRTIVLLASVIATDAACFAISIVGAQSEYENIARLIEMLSRSAIGFHVVLSLLFLESFKEVTRSAGNRRGQNTTTYSEFFSTVQFE
ncbi:hypothetical protein BJ742DRAFT_561011 [Cladochytrium replicatum]|nr:hypothetical protein BJ742DRAFT_561011 [Cladochytrium replicatum]